MKLTILKDVLNESIQHVAKAVSSRTTIPILSGIKMEATERGLTLTASDTDISIQSFVPIETDGKEIIKLEVTGSVVLPAKFFVDIIRKLPAEDVELDVGAQFQTTIRSGSAEIQIMGLDPEEYPVLPRLDESQIISIPADLMKSMIKQTIFAVSSNESTPVLTGVLWNLAGGKLKFVATDRHRLSQREANVDVGEGQEFRNIVISGKNLNELNKLLPDQNTIVDLVVSDNQVLFKLGNILFYTRILDGVYPDTTKIIPQQFKTELTVKTKAFMDAIDRAYLLSREEKTNIVRLATLDNGQLEISSSLSELGKITEQVDVSGFDGEPLKIAFNSKYMLDALKVTDSESITVGFTGAMSPIIVRPTEDQHLLHLILPYRTTN